MTPIIIIGVLIFGAILFLSGLKSLLFTCSPNEVLIISGRARREGNRIYGYRLVKGGYAVRWPIVERVDRMDLTNMVIDVSATNAYCKGGIPLTVQGVANVKIAGHEPVINNAIERFLGRSRDEVMRIAKATLEGSLRGILSTMTPEEINEDKILFVERLVHEVEGDMTSLGLVVDTMKIQNVHDEVKYLDSIGRKRSAEVVSSARISETIARSDAIVREAENLEREVQAQINGQVEFSKADAQRRLVDAQTRRAAVVAEEQAAVAALVAQAKADLDVQKARIEQVRLRMQADVVAPARAQAEAADNLAKAGALAIVADGQARADALRSLAASWKKAGPQARQVMLTQKIGPIIQALTNTIAETRVDKVTVIDSRMSTGNGPAKMIGGLEQIKQLFGIDIVEKLKNFGEQPAHVATVKVKEKPDPEPEGGPPPIPA
ncbi:MAG: flotillin family protein [Fimbriimonadaceae bacterium]